ncbi:MAG TPA: energy-coupling factor ABC transporter ATP-binding protein [Methanoregula sp.]|nr:energy-coupling factor ABC transporter ATP-binding protein [Methanoregula sp.]
MITFENIRYRLLAIDTLTLSPGITSVIGPNGSGKSTFLKICAGIALPESGTVFVDGRPPRDIAAGYVNEFPDRNIIFSSVKDELASPLRFCRTPCEETDRTVRACAGTMRITDLLDREMQELSGGEKVLVALATACINRPRVLVLDEYDSHLDASRCAWLQSALRVSGAEYIIRCTQQMETAAESNYLLYMEKGKVVHEGTPASVFSRLIDSPFYPISWRWPV